MWDRTNVLAAEYALDEYIARPDAKLVDRNVRRHFLDVHSDKLRILFGERRKIQLAIYRLLRKELQGRQPLLDLFSGVPNAVLPLVEESKVSQLTLVDRAPDPSVTYARQRLIKSLTRKTYISDLKMDITAETQDLPSSVAVTALESGITLPVEHRFDSEAIPPDVEGSESTRAPFFRSSQMGFTTVTFADVLQALSCADVPRTLRVVDTPVVARSLSSEAHRAYVEAAVQDVQGWSIGQWKPLSEGSPSSYGVLNFNPKY